MMPIALSDHILGVGWSSSSLLVGLGAGQLARLPSSGPFDSIERHDLNHDGMLAFEVSADGAHCASGGMDQRAIVFSNSEGAIRFEHDCGAWVDSLRFSPCNRYVAFGAGKRVWLRSLVSDDSLVLGPHEGTVAALDFSPDGSQLAVARYGAIDLWRVPTGEPIATLEWKSSMVSVAWQPRNLYLAAGCQDNAVHFWRLQGGKDSQMSGYPGKPKQLAWSQDGALLATGGGTSVVVWNFKGAGPEGSTPIVLEAHEKAITVLIASARDQRFASGSRDGAIRVWRPSRGTQPVFSVSLPDEITAIAFAPDSKRIAAADASGNVEIWPLKS